MVLGVIPFCALIFFNIKIYNRFMLTRGRFQGTSTRGSTQVSRIDFAINTKTSPERRGSTNDIF